MKNIILDKITKILSKVTLAKHKARKSFIGNFLLGLRDSRKVQFQELALHIASEMVFYINFYLFLGRKKSLELGKKKELNIRACYRVTLKISYKLCQGIR